MKIIVTGGGTGGHVYPVQAIVEEIKKSGSGIHVLWVGEKKSLEQEIAADLKVHFKSIVAGKLRRYLAIENIIDLFKFPIGFLQSLIILTKFKPDIVFGKGGYVSLPVLLAAKALKKKIVIHESDRIMGATNSLLFKQADQVLLNWPLKKPQKSNQQIQVVGTPIREIILKKDKDSALDFFNFSKNKKTILVMGGSQGSSEINSLFKEIKPRLSNTYQIIHITGHGKNQSSSRNGCQVFSNLTPEQMSWAYNLADLIVSRAGANSIAEILAWGKPSILIPLSTAANNHQEANARFIANQSAAVVLTKPTSDNLKRSIEYLLSNKKASSLMSKRAKEISVVDSAKEVVRVLGVSKRSKEITRVHFVGIGGIGVSALATWFLKDHDLVRDVFGGGLSKVEISGSDLTDSDIIQSLKKQGAGIVVGKHMADNLSAKTTVVVRSPAVPDDNPEIQKAKNLGVDVKTYPEILGEITKRFFTIAVSGMHGKTSTTSLLGFVFAELGFDPNVVVGAKIKDFNGSNFRRGGNKYLIIEADEYKASMLNYYPQIITLLNLEPEHLDYYTDIDDIYEQFSEYVSRLPKSGKLLVHSSLDTDKLRVKRQFKVYDKNTSINTNILKKSLPMPGKHVLENSLAVWSVLEIVNNLEKKYSSEELPEKFLEAVGKFRGAWRRFELKEEVDGVTIIDDYGHHPTEIKVTLQATKEKYPNRRLVCVFQAHQIKRTRALFSDFGQAFTEADQTIIADIYEVAGREEGGGNKPARIWAEKLVKKIPKAEYGGSLKELPNFVATKIKSGDVVIMMGAGDIWLETPRLIKLLKLGKIDSEANASLTEYTTYRVGGLAEVLARPKNSQELVEVLELCRKNNWPFKLLAGGSNVLISDKGVKGVVILNRSADCEILDQGLVKVDSGVNLGWLRQELLKENKTGLEWTTGIYGTIGGAIYGNAGAYGSEIASFVDQVEVFDVSTGKTKTMRKLDCGFGYRDSKFKTKPDWVIISIILKLKTGDAEEAKKTIAEHNKKRNQRPRANTAGSVFKNIVASQVSEENLQKLLNAGLKIDKQDRISVGATIEKCNLKGVCVGRACISKDHANYIITKKGTKASDVLSLVNLIKNKVKEKFGLQLQLENIIWE